MFEFRITRNICKNMKLEYYFVFAENDECRK